MHIFSSWSLKHCSQSIKIQIFLYTFNIWEIEWILFFHLINFVLLFVASFPIISLSLTSLRLNFPRQRTTEQNCSDRRNPQILNIYVVIKQGLSFITHNLLVVTAVLIIPSRNCLCRDGFSNMAFMLPPVMEITRCGSRSSQCRVNNLQMYKEGVFISSNRMYLC